MADISATKSVGRDGRYELLRQAAKGGSTETYCAIDTLLNREVAAVFYRRGDGAARILTNQAEAIGLLTHTNIVTLYDYLVDEHCIIFEWLNGQDLATAASSGNLVWQEVVPIFAQTSRALRHSHSKRIVHCNVKPKNIWIEDTGNVKLVDFAIAHMPWRSIRREGVITGTLKYLPPEIIVGSEPTGANDVYQLALTLYEVLTGAYPFQEDHPASIMNRIMSETPDYGPLQALALPEELISVIKQSLSKAPDQRPTIDSVVATLSAISESSPVSETGAFSANPMVRSLAIDTAPTMAFRLKETPPSLAKQLKVFLCHASEDKAAVRELYRNLCREGYSVWFDEEVLLPGQDWMEEIRKAVRASDVVIVCVSAKASSKRGFVQREIRMALEVAEEMPENSVYLIPVKLSRCEMPERLTRWHWVELFEERGFERLKRALSLRANVEL